MALTRAIGLTACATILATMTVTASTATAPLPSISTSISSCSGSCINLRALDTIRARDVLRVPPCSSSSPLAQSDCWTRQRRGLKAVTYLGRSFAVPYSWPVVDLTAHPSTWRALRRARRLPRTGLAASSSARPAAPVDATGALLIEPDLTRSTGVGAPHDSPLDHPISAEIDVTRARA